MNEYKKDMKKLSIKVIHVIDRLDSICGEYANWNEWDKAEIISKASSILKTEYENEIFEFIEVNKL